MSDNYQGLERRQSDLRAELDGIRGDVGKLREQFGELRGQFTAMGGALQRIEGRLDAIQTGADSAHRAQDDRLAQFAARLGYHDGERSVGTRLGEWCRQIVTAFASAGFTAGAMHFWGK